MEHFVKGNILQAQTNNFSTRDAHAKESVSIRCPHCSHVGVFQCATRGIEWITPEPHKDGSNQNYVCRAFIRTCPNPQCNGVVFTVTWGGGNIEILPPEVIDFDASGLPEQLLKTLEEAIACHSVGAYRAAAMMVRRLLEEICDESDAKGGDLHKRLGALKEKITLPEELFEAMGELKALGNDAAHVTAKNYASIGADEAEDSIELAKEILKARYQLKELLQRLRARKKSADQSE